ncbi:MAG: M20/M25/M40 family metallo-hydrolase [Acidobacteria bacterium]|nr:M20/M25/M40 family metallo-hydrolase [Acidobacteriota bacterium]
MPQFYSMMHTTLVPTILKGGFKSNVVPSDAEAVIDIRALPDEAMPALYAHMASIVNDPSITIKPLDTVDNMPAAPSSSLHTAMFRALEAAQQKLIPTAITIPMMTTGATDSAFLRARGVDAYGIRIPRTFDENEGVHGNDERINLKDLALYQQLVQQAIEQVSQ